VLSFRERFRFYRKPVPSFHQILSTQRFLAGLLVILSLLAGTLREGRLFSTSSNDVPGTPPVPV